jgi:hypothetical protein
MDKSSATKGDSRTLHGEEGGVLLTALSKSTHMLVLDLQDVLCRDIDKLRHGSCVLATVEGY